MVVQSLLDRSILFEESLFLLVIRLLVLLSPLQVLLYVVLPVVISTKWLGEVLDIPRLFTFGSDLRLSTEVHTKQAFSRNHHRFILCTSLSHSNSVLMTMARQERRRALRRHCIKQKKKEKK